MPCASLAIMLIARRSTEFAGTRFLKRGMNCAGFFIIKGLFCLQIKFNIFLFFVKSKSKLKFYLFVPFQGSVANDVETEQVVWSPSGPPSLRHGRFTAYVQRRGSVPLFWSQDSALRQGRNLATIGKPSIFIDRVEPHALTTAIHFRRVLLWNHVVCH